MCQPGPGNGMPDPAASPREGRSCRSELTTPHKPSRLPKPSPIRALTLAGKEDASTPGMIVALKDLGANLDWEARVTCGERVEAPGRVWVAGGGMGLCGDPEAGIPALKTLIKSVDAENLSMAGLCEAPLHRLWEKWLRASFGMSNPDDTSDFPTLPQGRA